jgi:hypothetical protein
LNQFKKAAVAAAVSRPGGGYDGAMRTVAVDEADIP